MSDVSSCPNLQPLPLGESEFPNLRKRGKIYVDKTKMVYELAKEDNKIFFARPRRFGKSLLVSTFSSLFKYGLRDFSGLEIEKLWKDKNAYSVVHLDLSRVSNFNDSEDFEKKFNSYLMLYMRANNLLDKDFDLTANGIEAFSVWLDWQPDSSVVLLIDEYDAPLTSCLNDPHTFLKVRNALSTFYSCLKGRSGAFRFLFLTGITKFGKAGIFSGLNHLVDITLVPEFGDIAGYSLEELKAYFQGYLRYSSEVLKISENELVEELLANYNGFCFEETAAKKVFAPWSVLNFFKWPKRGFRNYWFESGGQPTILQEYIKEHSLSQPEEFLKQKTLKISALSATSSSHEVDEEVLLVQTGYLTIKGSKNTTLYLGYPNQEVADSMADLYLNKLLRGENLEDVNAGAIADVVAKGDIEGFVKQVNNAFLALDYDRYFIKNEKTCEGAFLLILRGSGVQATTQVHNALGRSDLEFSGGNVHWVVELKFARDGEEVAKKALEGQKQMEERHYREQSSRQKLVRLVMVFSEMERHFVEYKAVK